MGAASLAPTGNLPPKLHVADVLHAHCSIASTKCFDARALSVSCIPLLF